ncbi:alpha/beta fold hydrolase [Flavobacterium kingsejongi]|uniref:Alpha/beta hydrolase n=1 Tax=Flavobacterium kingsejongi TaxID=1678728 RepID=A0A2S1LJQ6_9FLAO|nr:alpha/beta fold hydrolase [Flavobacterium kingsejongi]AWG23993.1 alpha/beta hydrolase [Flavobacterium kingsejongi]
MLYSRIEGQGKPLLILHGFLGMSDNWKTLGTQFAAQGFEVHMLDLRNHGRSFHSDEFSYAAMVSDVLEYCESHNLQTVDLIGHSMGGKVVMFFATAYPEKVEKLIVADIGVKYYPPHHQDILEGLQAVDFSNSPDRGQIEETLKEYVSDFGTRQFLMKNVYRETPEKLAFRMNLPVLTAKIDSIGEALPEDAVFEKPTLFLRGDKSRYILDEDYEGIKYHFPNMEIKTVSNAGHWLHAENPKEFFEYSIAYLLAD